MEFYWKIAAVTEIVLEMFSVSFYKTVFKAEKICMGNWSHLSGYHAYFIFHAGTDQ